MLTPKRTTPVQTTGEKTRCTAQVVTSSAMLATSFSVPVNHAATGSRLQASPRIPAAVPRRRQAVQDSASPRIVSTRASAAHVVLSRVA